VFVAREDEGGEEWRAGEEKKEGRVEGSVFDGLRQR